MTNGRAKGCRGERDGAREWARVTGCQARRGQQFSGGTDSPDIVHDCGAIHLEVKRVERGNPYLWMEQAVRDCGGKIPLVLHRRNNKPWLAIVRLDDVPGLAQEIAQKAEALGGGAVPGSIPGQGLPAHQVADADEGRRDAGVFHDG